MDQGIFIFTNSPTAPQYCLIFPLQSSSSTFLWQTLLPPSSNIGDLDDDTHFIWITQENLLSVRSVCNFNGICKVPSQQHLDQFLNNQEVGLVTRWSLGFWPPQIFYSPSLASNLDMEGSKYFVTKMRVFFKVAVFLYFSSDNFMSKSFVYFLFPTV